MSIFSIGHYNYELDTFLEMLKKANITMIVDVRAFPNSKRHLEYNKESFEQWLADQNINYQHIQLLGGRRKQSQEVGPTLNEGWENQSFHNYADYTLTDDFKIGINELIENSKKYTVAMLCAEQHPSRCHRLIISNWLVAHDIEVNHIILRDKDGIKIVPHQLGQWGAMPIIEDDGEVVYPK
ncbi:DUF488 domain-containing protein [Mammaliicoccus vitulinus]|uniref:DUF488 domain-containing protein n=2 Tax=Mammaliicoccus vitulinus TaxID=71237 RepID=UPI001ADEFB0E|nr:DUF488 domain-containing protein [Mammaliicoccus vitulinus]QTN10949.1 DUF488 domain-containing protein [Mammaliicoccus vitulinus]